MVNSCDNSFTLNFLKYVQSPLCNKHLITLIECFDLHIFMSRLDSLFKKFNAGNVQLDDISSYDGNKGGAPSVYESASDKGGSGG